MKVKIRDIIVADRIRKDLGDVESLAASMHRRGLLHPIIIDQDNKLVAGGRRLAAAKMNGYEEIDAFVRDDLDPISRLEIELEENLCRMDMHWTEEVVALRNLYELKRAKYSDPLDKSSGYSMRDAAEETGKALGGVSMDIQLAGALAKYPELGGEGSKVAAFKRYKRMEETQMRAEIAKRARDKQDPFESIGATEAASGQPSGEPVKPGEIKPGQFAHQPIRKIHWPQGDFYHADSRDVCYKLPKHSVDCIVTDPPFALGMHKEGATTANTRLAQNAGHMYDDDPAKIMDMLDLVFLYCSHLLKPGGHAYVFFHMTKYEEMFLMLRKAFGSCEETPIMWIKNTPGVGDPNRAWVYAYEPCFHINTGRDLVRPQAFNYLKYDTVPPNRKIHPTQKPDALLRHVISASCVAGEVVLDPFAGGGSTLVAASQVGCRFIGIEREEIFHRATTERIAEELAAGEEVKDDQEQTSANDSTATA